MGTIKWIKTKSWLDCYHLVRRKGSVDSAYECSSTVGTAMLLYIKIVNISSSQLVNATGADLGLIMAMTLPIIWKPSPWPCKLSDEGTELEVLLGSVKGAVLCVKEVADTWTFW